MNLGKLRQDHADLMVIALRLGEVVKQPASPPAAELFVLRRELSATLVAHLKAEDWALYPRLVDCGDSQVAAIARTFSDEMGGLAAAYTGYNEHWTAVTIADDWPGFCRDTSAILGALSDRIRRENQELYPLLEKIEQAA